MNVEQYNSLYSRHERSKFINNLAQTLRYTVGFRFLKRTNTGSGTGKKKKMRTEELSDEEIRAKVGHALRDLSIAMEQEGENQVIPESKVPRPSPYKKQDKKFQHPEPLRIVSSSSSCCETITSSMDGTVEEDRKLSALPCPSSQVPSSDRIAPIQGQETARRVSSLSAESSTMDGKAEEGQDIKEKSSKAVLRDEACNNGNKLKAFQLDIEEACQSLLKHPPTHLIPTSFDDDITHYEDEDYYEMINDLWTNNDNSSRHARSIGTLSFDGSGCGSTSYSHDMMSLTSSCCLSDAMETLSLVSSS